MKTLTIHNRTTHGYDFPYVATPLKEGETLKNYNGIRYVTLAPGFTTGIPQQAFDQIVKNPVFIHAQAQYKLSVVNREELAVKGVKHGHQYIDDIRYGEEQMLSHHSQLQSKTKKYVPTKDLLKQFVGVGDATASKILGLMPEGGWENFTAMTEHVKSVPSIPDIDWETVKATN